MLWDGFSNSDLTTAGAVILNLIPDYEASLTDTDDNFPGRRELVLKVVSALQSQEFAQLTIKPVFVAASLDKLPPAPLTLVAPLPNLTTRMQTIEKLRADVLHKVSDLLSQVVTCEGKTTTAHNYL